MGNPAIGEAPFALEMAIAADPTVATSAAATSICSAVGPRSVAGRATPFQETVDPASNPWPWMVSVKEAAPAATESGSNDVASGPGAKTAKGRFKDSPPPGPEVKTVICAVLGTARRAAGTTARNWPEEKTVVGRVVPFQRMTVWMAPARDVVVAN